MIFKFLRIVLLLFILLLNKPLTACTGITATQGEVVLFGNNEDWSDPNTFVWFEPSGPGKFGGIYFGYADFFPQGGMNEKGLCYDGFATVTNPIHNPHNKPEYPGIFIDKVMEECQTVGEVIAMFNRYYIPWLARCQFIFVDRTGSSAIIEGDSVIYKEGDYQVVTNFYQSNPQLGGWPCWRYNTAVRMLENSDSVSVDLFRSILDAAHQKGSYPTQYSNICDLKQGVVYLYYYHDFENCVIINLEEELKVGAHTYALPSLFNTSANSIMTTPVDFRLHQNYPNPFNSTTTIQFDLFRASKISIKIYNLQGKLIRSLSDESTWGIGSNSIIWDGKDFMGNDASSGTFLYKFEMETINETRKMLLLR